MSIAGIGQVHAGLSYDFTKLTNQQILDVSKDLLRKGTISNNEAGELALYASGGEWVPIHGDSPSVASVLSDPTQRNLLGILSEWSAANHTRASFKGEEITDNLLTDLSALQSGGPDAVANSVRHTAETYQEAFTPNYVLAVQGAGDATINSLITAFKRPPCVMKPRHRCLRLLSGERAARC